MKLGTSNEDGRKQKSGSFEPPFLWSLLRTCDQLRAGQGQQIVGIFTMIG